MHPIPIKGSPYSSLQLVCTLTYDLNTPDTPCSCDMWYRVVGAASVLGRTSLISMYPVLFFTYPNIMLASHTHCPHLCYLAQKADYLLTRLPRLLLYHHGHRKLHCYSLQVLCC